MPAALRLALIQTHARTNDRDTNVDRACSEIDRICRDPSTKPDLIALPELFNNEYFPQHRNWDYLKYAESIGGPTISRMQALAEKNGVYVVAPIFEVTSPGHYYDSAVVIGANGEIVTTYRKTHPAAMESLEKIYFRPGSQFPVFTHPTGWKVGLIICYDTYFPEAARSVALRGAELLVVPFAGGTADHWYDLLSIRAFENLVFLAACNKVGTEDKQPFGGRSCVYDPFGHRLASAGADAEETLAVTLDYDTIWQARRRYTMYRDRRPDLYRALVTEDEELLDG